MVMRANPALAWFPTFILLALCVGQSRAADHQHGPTGAYTEWHWPEPPPDGDGSPGYKSFELGLTIEREPPADVGYFWSHQVELQDGDTAYFGLQTLGRRPDGSEGKVAIFSIWKALGARGPGIAQPFSGEGEGYQTVIPYAWKPGRMYRLRMFRSGESRRGTEWSATVRDESSGEVSPIGTITVPKKWGGLGAWSVMWSERYTGPEVRTCDDVGYSRVTFTAPTADGGSVRPDRHHSYVTDPANCPNSRVTGRGGRFRQEMGIPE
jgi:hypothetical protein